MVRLRLAAAALAASLFAAPAIAGAPDKLSLNAAGWFAAAPVAVTMKAPAAVAPKRPAPLALSAVATGVLGASSPLVVTLAESLSAAPQMGKHRPEPAAADVPKPLISKSYSI